MTAHDPVVRLETVAAAAGVALNTLRRALVAGEIPPSDTIIRDGHAPSRAWRLSTLRAWRPDLAARCAAILAALESFPRPAA